MENLQPLFESMIALVLKFQNNIAHPSLSFFQMLKSPFPKTKLEPSRDPSFLKGLGQSVESYCCLSYRHNERDTLSVWASCMARSCLRRLLLEVYALLQYWHTCGFSPVWVLQKRTAIKMWEPGFKFTSVVPSRSKRIEDTWTTKKTHLRHFVRINVQRKCRKWITNTTSRKMVLKDWWYLTCSLRANLRLKILWHCWQGYTQFFSPAEGELSSSISASRLASCACAASLWICPQQQTC